MIRIAGAVQRSGVLLGLARTSQSVVPSVFAGARYFSYGDGDGERQPPRRLRPRDSGDRYGGRSFDRNQGLELRPPRTSSNTNALHVSNVHPETTDAEFKDAFSGLSGLVKTELVFNSGALKDFKGTSHRGFGFLHFESAEAAQAAAGAMRESPVRLQGYATVVNPYTARSQVRNEETHVLQLTGLPLDAQYLQIVAAVKEKCRGFKSLRLMTNKEQEFLGAAGVAFVDAQAAADAKEALLGTSIGDLILRDHNLAFGRPLYDDMPTRHLMLIGTPTDEEGVEELKTMIEALPGVERYNVVKDRETQEPRNLTIIDCDHEDAAWNIVDYLNREAPQFRVAFITDRRTHQSRNGVQGGSRRFGGNFRSREGGDRESRDGFNKFNRDGPRRYNNNNEGGFNRDNNRDRYSRPPRRQNDYSPRSSSDDF